MSLLIKSNTIRLCQNPKHWIAGLLQAVNDARDSCAKVKVYWFYCLALVPFCCWYIVEVALHDVHLCLPMTLTPRRLVRPGVAVIRMKEILRIWKPWLKQIDWVDGVSSGTGISTTGGERVILGLMTPCANDTPTGNFGGRWTICWLYRYFSLSKLDKYLCSRQASRGPLKTYCDIDSRLSHSQNTLCM